MINNFKIFSLRKTLKQRLDDEEFLFKVATATKFVLISLAFTLSVLLFTYLLIKIDLIYFVAHGFPGAMEFQDAFYEFVFSSLTDHIPWMVIVALFIFVFGFYLSGILIRPFREISRSCEGRMNNNPSYYSPDFFSDLKLLTSFSVFFFARVDEAQRTNKLEKVEIPNDFLRIHKPVFEANFFFNYFFVIAIFGLIASVGIFVINNHLREQIFLLAQKFLHGPLNSGKGVHYFLEEQFSVSDIAVYFFVSLHLGMYLLFGAHLYGKVSAPAFAVFATLRSFLKGNYHNRIHLIGYYYLRRDCRIINKYLDHLQRELVDKKSQS